MALSKYYAHRGFHTKDLTIPENTLPAFEAAITRGYGIETDVQLSRDHVIYVYHDTNLKRLTGIDRNIQEMTAEEIEQVRINGEKIPTFDAFLKCVSGQVPLIIELKTSGKKNTALSRAVRDRLKTYKGDYVIESFDPRIVYWFKKNAPEIGRGQLVTVAGEYDNIGEVLLLPSLLCNLFTKPTFTAIDQHLMTNRFKKWFYRRFGTQLVGWTIRKPEDGKGYPTIIFEYFEPK